MFNVVLGINKYFFCWQPTVCWMHENFPKWQKSVVRTFGTIHSVFPEENGVISFGNNIRCLLLWLIASSGTLQYYTCWAMLRSNRTTQLYSSSVELYLVECMHWFLVVIPFYLISLTSIFVVMSALTQRRIWCNLPARGGPIE